MKKPDLKKLKEVDFKKAARDFVYGKPHGERRLGDLYIPKTGLYKHREWRGIKDTMYYFNNIWLYNYGMIVHHGLRRRSKGPDPVPQGNMEIQMDGSDIPDSNALVRQMP